MHRARPAFHGEVQGALHRARGTVVGDGEGALGDGTEELFLIDGNSLAYRAFFALPESIATADGRPTNAIYGFASMMSRPAAQLSSRRT